ncbi:hypothetical protein BDP27DRAFT_1432280 [Rhodocollybia butyracea]|uniref:Uncharacterized protein n=1 Tax=Rhodocollybia butyracea TaxID=206335 RepID=A0A9P5TWV9_9AGAR|nr:hypothetical protein BDP27DRAFT_1432280 [Rhodocollybia butyracea]
MDDSQMVDLGSTTTAIPPFTSTIDPSNNSLDLTFTADNESITLSFDSANETLTSVNTSSTLVTTATPSAIHLPMETLNGGSITTASSLNESSNSLYSSNLSFVTTTVTPTQSQLFDTPASYTISLNPITAVRYGYIQHLPSPEIWGKWKRGYYIGDPLDNRIKASIFFDEQRKSYRTPFSDEERILPPQAPLQQVPPECLPHVIKDIPCLALGTPLLHGPVMGSGTLIPASSCYKRGLVLTPLFHTDRLYYILCLHDDHDLFLIRVHERFMDKQWSSWKQLKQIYGKNCLTVLFSAGVDNFEQILEGVKRQHSFDRYVSQQQYGSSSSLGFLPNFWNSLTKSCGERK